MSGNIDKDPADEFTHNSKTFNSKRYRIFAIAVSIVLVFSSAQNGYQHGISIGIMIGIALSHFDAYQ